MARYEQLRSEGIEKTMSRELAVFLAEGMYAWMQAWLSFPVETGEGFEKGRGGGLDASKNEQTRFSPPRTGSSTGIRAEVVNILAAMSLEQLRGDGI
jgi:hypothetical protein